MANRRFSFEELNAYVDGEADAALAAEIAAVAASDRRAAEEIAAIAQLKAASRTALEQVSAAPPPIAARAKRPPLLRTAAARLGALAASLLLVALLAATGLRLLQPVDQAQAWLSTGALHYQHWRADQGRQAPTRFDGGNELWAEASVAGTLGYVPDLSAARMQLAHVAVVSEAGGDNLFVGYVGRNGCRLGLWIGAAPEGLPEELVVRDQANGETAATWRVGGTAYAAIARDMDKERFQAVVGYLHVTTRRAPREETVRMAGSRAGGGAPCLLS